MLQPAENAPDESCSSWMCDILHFKSQQSVLKALGREQRNIYITWSFQTNYCGAEHIDNYTMKMLFSLNITQLTLIKSLYKDTLHRQSPWALFRNHLEGPLHTNRCSTVMSPGMNPIHYLIGRCSHSDRPRWHLAKTEDVSVSESHSAFGSGHSETRNGYSLPGLLGGEVL